MDVEKLKSIVMDERLTPSARLKKIGAILGVDPSKTLDGWVCRRKRAADPAAGLIEREWLRVFPGWVVTAYDRREFRALAGIASPEDVAGVLSAVMSASSGVWHVREFRLAPSPHMLRVWYNTLKAAVAGVRKEAVWAGSL